MSRSRLATLKTLVGLHMLLTAAPAFGQVSQAWVQRYNGPANSLDEARAIAIDASGNVFVTGRSAGVGTNVDYATVKYDSAGNVMWVMRYDFGIGRADTAMALRLGVNGHVYVTGMSRSTPLFEDYATIKYDPDGQPSASWPSTGFGVGVRRYDGPTGEQDQALAMAVDALDNVYVTGKSKGPGSDYDYLTIKYNAGGAEDWVRRYNGPGNGLDEARGIVVDSAGNVYVTGLSAGSGTDFDYATIKYSANGTELWVSRYNGPANQDDQAVSLSMGTSEDVYVTGYSKGVGTDYDYATIRYDRVSGAEVAVARYAEPTPAGRDDRAVGVAVDADGNVIVAGKSWGTSLYDYVTVKYDSDLNLLWERRLNWGPSFDEAQAMTLDGDGNVYVTGLAYTSPATGRDYVTVKYSADGTQQWATSYSGPGAADDFALAVAAGPDGSVCVTGTSVGSGTGNDYATVKYVSLVQGDLNCDGVFDAADVPAFVLALVDPVGYGQAYPQCNISLADMNGDDEEDGADIQDFVDALIGT